VSVTAPQGFRAAGIAAGIKVSGNPDLALVVNDGPLDVAAAVFTSNKVKAAPVLWSQQVFALQRAKAVILNAGGANACTGPQGFQDTHATAEKVAAQLNIGAIDVGVCSTGLIGELLPMDAVLSGVEKIVGELGDSAESGLAAATAVMTTDTKPKQASVTLNGFTVGGFSKGAGMLAPGLATMLVVLTTDAEVSGEVAQSALGNAAAVTFNRLDIDGSMSTNDSVILLASGASGIAASEADLTAALTEVSLSLAKQMQADAEGVTKEITVTVSGAASEEDAVVGARAVARDSLVKTAMFGSDPNWGRIAAAIGAAPIELNADTLSVTINGKLLCDKGYKAAERDTVDLTGREALVEIELGLGSSTATVYTTDLSHAYVEENSAYSS
jgi:glutamate N-acetyltransferase/amino-acid N-acetyltransferase